MQKMCSEKKIWMKLMTLSSQIDENINIAFILNPASMPDFFTAVFIVLCEYIKTQTPCTKAQRA